MHYSSTVHVLFTHLKILKMDLIALFTHLKIILLQCFQFSVSATISSIQMDSISQIYYFQLSPAHPSLLFFPIELGNKVLS